MRAKEERGTVCSFQHAVWDWDRSGDGTGSRDSNERAELGKREKRAPVPVSTC